MQPTLRPSTPIETKRYQPYPVPSSLCRSSQEQAVPHRPGNVYGENVHPVEAEKLTSAERSGQNGTSALDEDAFGEGNSLVNFHHLNSKFGSDFLNYLLTQGVETVSSQIPVHYRDVARLPAEERKAWDSAHQDEIDVLWK